MISLLCVAATALLVPRAIAQQTLPTWAATPRHVPRKALIIGIDKYDHATQLVTTAYDVNGIRGVLEKLHFDDVDELYTGGSISRTDMIANIRAFAAKLGSGDLAFLYYSGHGTELNTVNYLVPTEGVAEPKYPGTDWLGLDWIVSEIAKQKPGVIVVVLDACRADPFVNTEVEWRDVVDPTDPLIPDAKPLTGGLVATLMQTDASQVVAYAAGYKQVAYSRFKDDPKGVQSIYTRQLLTQLPASSTLGSALARAEKLIPDMTAKRQVPVTLQRAAYDVPLDGTKPEPAIVEEEWRYVANTVSLAKQLEALLGFLGDHPASGYAPLARARVDEIKSGLALERTPNELAEIEATDAPPPPANFEYVLGSLQAGAVREGRATAIVSSPVQLRAKPNGGSKLTTLTTGAMVRLVELKGHFAKIISPDGVAGWIGGVGAANQTTGNRTVEIAFEGTDEYAPVRNWTPLSNAAANLSAKGVGVTIRIGAPSVEGEAHRDYVARLRSLRVRDYVTRLGAMPENVVTMSPDPATPADTATITIGALPK
jgi:hypothetical protein